MAITDQMIASDKTKMQGYFSKGVFFSREINLDSARILLRTYQEIFKGYCPLCDNNIGQIYFVTNHTDSARKYFLQILSHDSTIVLHILTLGTIELKEGDSEAAIAQFNATIDYSTVSLEGFVTNLQLYFGKTYDTTDAIAYKEFTRQPFMFNMQYGSYLSMLYTYIRVPGFIDSTGKINFLFNQLLTISNN